MSETDYTNLTSSNYETSVYDMLERDMNNKLLQSNANFQLVMRHDSLFKDAIKFNDLTYKMEIFKDLGWPRTEKSFCDNDLDNIITRIESLYHLSGDTKAERAVKVVAHEKHFHPVIDKLNSLVWDGVPRLENTLYHFLGVEKTPLSIEGLKLFMLGAISRIFHPGCKFEYMLCLVGGQGAGKSTFIRFLAMQDDWFTDDIKKLDDKVFQYIQGHWIIEIPEMLAILKADHIEETKAFISRQRDNFRIPYDKYAADHPRQSVFASTSNKTQFLPMDKSGNRRFIPIKVNAANAEVHILDNEKESREYIEQVWAEVMVIYNSGDFCLKLSDESSEELLQFQEEFSPEDPIEAAIRSFIEEECPQYICTRLLYEKALGHFRTEIPKQWESNAIGEIMDQKFPQYKRISTHRFPEYGPQRSWVLNTHPAFKPITQEESKELPFK